MRSDRYPLVLSLLVQACTGAPSHGATSAPSPTSATGDTTVDATADTTVDATADSTADDQLEPTGEPGCALPDPAPDWMAPLQQDLVARLSGAAELTPGVVLADRASEPNRAATVDFLIDQLDGLGLPAQLQPYSATGRNVYVTVPAALDTDRAVVIGAHFDTVAGSPGANDNATGVAMILSLARWLDELPCRELDAILVLLDEEEVGRLGSQAFAAWLTTQSLDVVSVHTIDQMGWDADGDRALELERADEGLYELYAQAEPLAPGDTPLIPTDTGFTDHVSFREQGFAAVGLTEEFASGDTSPHYHLPSDAFETIDLDYLGSSTALLHVAIGRLVSPSAG